MKQKLIDIATMIVSLVLILIGLLSDNLYINMITMSSAGFLIGAMTKSTLISEIKEYKELRKEYLESLKKVNSVEVE